MLSPGTTVLIPSGPLHDPHRKHLHIVVARKSGPPAQILMVSVCSMTVGYEDATTCCAGGEHPFICKPSYVRYSDARYDNEADIQRGIDKAIFELHEPCRAEFLEVVLGGFNHSPFAKPFTVNFIEEAD